MKLYIESIDYIFIDSNLKHCYKILLLKFNQQLKEILPILYIFIERLLYKVRKLCFIDPTLKVKMHSHN